MVARIAQLEACPGCKSRTETPPRQSHAARLARLRADPGHTLPFRERDEPARIVVHLGRMAARLGALDLGREIEARSFEVVVGEYVPRRKKVLISTQRQDCPVTLDAPADVEEADSRE